MQVCHFQHLLRQFDKNEPGRFLGEGVSFRAKLIGVLEVPEARGDRMCQEALADLKMAIRAAGEHKQRIQVHVAIDGLRLRDDKTGDSLYHHPVHKISFIAQDMTDSRAFGYIFGSPDTGHRFFGIKTDKAASQVVIAMRDLFQVVFELKKKEIELAKQQLEGKSVTSSILRHTSSASSEVTKSKNVTSTIENTSLGNKNVEGGAEGGVAELVDLEQELSYLRRGLTLVEGLTPSSDPFGDSFIVQQQSGLLPPPPSGSSTRGRNTPATPRAPLFSPNKTTTNTAPSLPPLTTDYNEPASLVDSLGEPSISAQNVTSVASLGYDVFTELDPLGTGRSKPYVDKKLFFQELKNPPKKVLKDLVPVTVGDVIPTTTNADVKDDQIYSATTITSVPRHSGGSVSIKNPSSMFTGGGAVYSSDPFAETDPFDSADPFTDTFKEDPFVTGVPELPKQTCSSSDTFKNNFNKLLRGLAQEGRIEGVVGDGQRVFNGPLHVSLPPEPAPKSPRPQRQSASESSTVRQRPQPSSKLTSESASPPPPLPPKKACDLPPATRPPPPRPPHDHDHTDSESGPPLPRPSRRREPTADRTTKPRLSSAATNSSEDEYLTPVPPPVPGGRRFDITLSQLLTCGLEELATRLRVPAASLASMTLPQLTAYLRSYLAADSERANIHIEPSNQIVKEKVPEPKSTVKKNNVDFKSQFEDNFAPTTDTNGTFVANFDDFDKKSNPSYDRYAAFREMQEQELNNKSILDPTTDNQRQNGDSELGDDSDEKEELSMDNVVINDRQQNDKRDSHSPMKSLDELTLNSFNVFRNSVSPKPSQIDAKIEDIKSVMKNLQLEQSRRSVSPRDETKEEKASDRYAALREITITEPLDEFESLPPEAPKERKRSDEKSDGFDNSDFFDCIDNSSLSFSHVDDAFRKSPSVKEKVESEIQVEEKKMELLPPTDVVRVVQPPARLSTGSLSDVPSGSSPDTKDKSVSRREGSGGRWSVLAARASPWSSDSESAAWRDRRLSPPPPVMRPRRRTRDHHCRSREAIQRQTSSSSRDVSPWEEEPPPIRHHRGPSHHRDSRHNSSGSRECLDSGSGRDKEKIRDKRDARERDRDGRESTSTRERDRRDSGSGRDRAGDLSKERDHRDRRDRRSRDRDKETWDRDRDYSRERDYRDSRSRERLSKDYRDKERDRHRIPHHSWDDEEEYSDGCGSGRSSPRDRYPEHRWRRDDRNYGSLGWRESRRRPEIRPDDNTDRRYGSTLGWSSRRTGSGGTRSDRRRSRREESRQRPGTRDQREHSHSSPFDNDYVDTPTATKKRGPYSSLEGTRFAFEPEETTASPVSVGGRFRFDSDSISPRSLFEDDFATLASTQPRVRAASIAEEEEGELPPLRVKPPQSHRDIKKSDSVNIFVRETDPFEGDDFFACTGSDRAARRENWPGDFQAFDNV